MTYVYDYTVGNDNVKVEYCHSSITDSIKVVDMWVNDKYHRVNWMSPTGKAKLMQRLEQDMTDRMCGSYLDGLQTTGFDTEIDRFIVSLLMIQFFDYDSFKFMIWINFSSLNQ